MGYVDVCLIRHISNESRLDDVFKDVADPTRREEMSAGELAARFDMSKPTMPHYFAVLKAAGLLTSRREGQTVWYAPD